MAKSAKVIASPAVLRIRREVFDIRQNVDSLTADYLALGEESNWTDERLDDLEEKIDFWTARANQLAAQARTMHQRPPQTAA